MERLVRYLKILLIGLVAMAPLAEGMPLHAIDSYDDTGVWHFDDILIQGDSLSICVGDTSGMYGACVCIPITVECFQDMLSFQFTMNWDPIAMDLCTVIDIHQLFAAGGLDFEFFEEQGWASVIWEEPTFTPQTLPAGDTLFMLCLTPKTTPGTIEPVWISDDVLDIASSDISGSQAVKVKPGEIEVTEPDSMVLVYSSCPNGADLTFDFSIFGGLAPYDYEIFDVPGASIVANGTISSSGEIENVFGIPTTEIEITIIDSNGDTLQLTLPFTNVDPQFFFPAVGIINETCPGAGDGGLFLVDVFGGSGNYYSTWIGSDILVYNLDTLSSIPAGTYVIALQDAITGCVDTTELTVITDSLELSLVSAVPPDCNGMSDGQISVGVNQQGQFEYTWLDSNLVVINQYMAGPNTNLVGLEANNYTIIVSNGNCSDSLEVSLPEVSGMYLELDTIQHNLCFRDRDGRITVNIFSTTDSLGFDPDLVTWSPFPNGATIQDFGKEASILFVPAGIYTVEATDSLGCTISETFEVTEPPELVINLSQLAPPLCPDIDGSLDLANLDHGGTPPYLFSWEVINSDTVTGMTDMINGLTHGDSVTIFLLDGNACEDTFALSFSGPPEIDIQVLTPISCTGSPVGALQVVGDITGSNILWSTGSSSEIVTDLPAGNYSVTVTDQSGCIDSVSVLLAGDAGIVITTDSLQGISCNGASDGAVAITILSAVDSIPTTPFDVAWDPVPGGSVVTNMGAQSQLSGLPAGSYNVIVEDSSGCTVGAIFVLSQPSPLAINLDSLSPPACPNTTGSLDMTQVDHGGTGPYMYVWELFKNDTVTFGFTGVVPGLRPGDSLTIFLTDANGCQDTAILAFNDGPEIEIQLDGSVLCPGEDQGSLSVIGQLSGTSILWSTGDTVPSIDSLIPGTYGVTVTDSGGCSAQATFDLPDTMISVVLLSPMEFMGLSACGEPDSGLISNEVLDYPGTTEYIWHTLNDSVTAIPALIISSPGTYGYSVRDVNTGCIIFSGSVIATFDSGFNLQSNATDLLCANDSTGTLSIQIAGGSGSYLFDWETLVDAGPLGADFRDGLSAGTYHVTVTDANNTSCSVATSIEILQPPPLEIELPGIISPVCDGDETLVTVSGAIGGTAPYEFTIDGGVRQSLGTPIPLVSGTYTITLFDASGCTRDSMILIEDQGGFSVDLDADIVMELGDSVQLNAILTPSIVIDTILWDPGVFLGCLNCLDPWARPFSTQLYTLTVVDTNGCLATDDILITVQEKQEDGVYIPNVFSPNGDGINDLFQVYFGPAYTGINEFAIYNRWGGVLHSGINRSAQPAPTLIWDGTTNGEHVGPGVYVYKIAVTLLSGQMRYFTGDITVIR